MRGKTAIAGLLLIMLALSGCGMRENAAQEQLSAPMEKEPVAEATPESRNPDAGEQADETDADSTACQEDTTGDASSVDMNQEEMPEADSDSIEGNGSYFVRVGTEVYFRTYEPDVFDSYVLDGDFLSCAFAERGTSAICRYDERTGEVRVIAEDGCTGKLYYCGGRFYYDNDSRGQVWTATPDGAFGLFAPGSVAGVSENGAYIALWQEIGDDPRSIHVLDREGKECSFLPTFDFMQVIFCGVTDDGNIIFIGTDENEETGLYSCVAGRPSEIVFLGSIPLENIFVDISCDRFFTQGEDVYCVIGYYGGPVSILERYLYVRMRPEEADSMEVLEQGERDEAIFDEPLYLTHSIFGSRFQRKFLYGDLLYRDDNMRESVLVENFISYADRERLIMQTGEILGDYAYLCIAEAERVPEEDYKVFRAYSYQDMYYLRIPMDGNGEIESIYGPSWDNAKDFRESDFAPYIGEWRMNRMRLGEASETPADRAVTAVIKDDLTLTIRDASADADVVYVLSNLMDDAQHTSVWYDDYYSGTATGKLDGDELILNLPIQLESIDDPGPASWTGYYSRKDR